MAPNSSGDVPTERKPLGPGLIFRNFLGGLSISLPLILTVVILLWLSQGVYSYIVRPISYGVKWAYATNLDKSKDFNSKDFSLLDNLHNADDRYETVAQFAGVKREDLPDLYLLQGSLTPEYVVINGEAVPFRDYQFVNSRISLAEMPRSSKGIYMFIATEKYFRGQVTLSIVASLIVIILLFFLGTLFTKGVGGWAVRKFESAFVSRVPLVSNVYSSVKQVTDFFFTERTIKYNRIVAIEYPRRGIWSLGFVTGEGLLEMTIAAGEPLVSILVPTSPMPVTGYTINVPKTEIIDLNMTIDQAFQFCISCGVLVPDNQKVTAESLQQALTQRLTSEANQPVVMRPAESEHDVDSEPGDRSPEDPDVVEDVPGESV